MPKEPLLGQQDNGRLLGVRALSDQLVCRCASSSGKATNPTRHPNRGSLTALYGSKQRHDPTPFSVPFPQQSWGPPFG